MIRLVNSVTPERALDILMFNHDMKSSKRIEAYSVISKMIDLFNKEPTTDDLISLRAEIKDKFGTLDYFAYKMGVTPQYITHVLNGRSKPSKPFMLRARTLLDSEKSKKVFVEQDVELIKKLHELTSKILNGENYENK